MRSFLAFGRRSITAFSASATNQAAFSASVSGLPAALNINGKSNVVAEPFACRPTNLT